MKHTVHGDADHEDTTKQGLIDAINAARDGIGPEPTIEALSDAIYLLASVVEKLVESTIADD